MIQLRPCVFAVLPLCFATSAPAAEPVYTLVAKSNGARQCESSHVELAALQGELTSAGIAVALAACGADGLARPAVCGADAGEIGIFGIAAEEGEKVQALGFRLLADLPEAVQTACRDKSDAAAEFAPAAEGSIYGIGPGVDQAAYRKVRATISKAIAQGAADDFLVYGYGKEGGFSFCVQKARFADPSDFSAFVRKLRAVRPNPSTTAYSTNFAPACARTAQ